MSNTKKAPIDTCVDMTDLNAEAALEGNKVFST